MDYEERHPGEATTLQCRKEAEETIDKQRRYNQILEIMNEFKNIPLTANEIAMEMFRRHLIPTTERNFAAPRVNEGNNHERYSNEDARGLVTNNHCIRSTLYSNRFLW